jgi:hypothetical protein
MARAFDLAATHDPSLRVRLAKGQAIRHFEIRPVPLAHAWQSWVERDSGPHHALFFTWRDAVAAREAYEREIAGCLCQGWQIVDLDSIIRR